MTKAEEKVKQLATEAAKTVLQDAAVAKSALDTQTSMSIRQIQNDIGEIKEILKINMVSKEEFHPVQEQVIDHESRIRAIEKWVWGAIGVMAVAQIIVYIVTHK